MQFKSLLETTIKFHTIFFLYYALANSKTIYVKSYLNEIYLTNVTGNSITFDSVNNKEHLFIELLQKEIKEV